MGFWEGLGRLVTGKPVFQPGDQQGGRPTNLPPPNGTQPDAVAPPQQVPGAGPKVLPLVTVQRIEPHISGDHVEYYFAIENHSDERVELDKIRVLNVSRELDNFLNPHEEKEFLVFSGPRPRTTAYNNAEIYYKNARGDYFMSSHYVEFDDQPDGTYTISRLRFTPPVRDV